MPFFTMIHNITSIASHEKGSELAVEQRYFLFFKNFVLYVVSKAGGGKATDGIMCGLFSCFSDFILMFPMCEVHSYKSKNIFRK